MLLVSRRALIGAALAGGVAAAAPTAAAAAAVSPIRDGYEFLDRMFDAYQDGAAIRLPQSYTDQVGLFSTGFTYDAALAVLAFLAGGGQPGMIGQAHRIGTGLIYAQQHDPLFTDGRLRQAYTVGPYTRGGVTHPDGFVRGDGTVNAGGPFGFTGSYTGDQAWAGIALAALYEFTGDGAARQAALRLGAWIWRTCHSQGPLGGFTGGLGKDGHTPIPTMSTAHNAVLVALFGRLARLVGTIDAQHWLRARGDAAGFVAKMWNPALGHFHRGSPDGEQLLHGAPSLDGQVQACLALGNPDALPWVAGALTVTDTSARRNSALPAGKRVTGVTVSTASRTADPTRPIEPGLPRPDPSGVWFEGCAQYACALRHSPDPSSVPARLAVLADAQATLGAGQTVGGTPLPDGYGVVAASSPVTAGFDPTGYYPSRHVAATAWYLLAATATNPLA
jgi:hypothetical protein